MRRTFVNWSAGSTTPPFAERQHAAQVLEKLEDRVAAGLRAALNVSHSAETRRALQWLIERIDARTPEMLQASRAVEALEQIATPGAKGHLNAAWARASPSAASSAGCGYLVAGFLTIRRLFFAMPAPRSREATACRP